MKKIDKILKSSLTFSKAHYNTYRIVTGKLDLDELAEKEPMLLLMCEPNDLIEYSKIIEVCEDLIEYYQQQEDYEKCADIKKAMKVYERKLKK